MYMRITSISGFQYIDNGRSLIVASILKSHEGNFTCVGINIAGTDSDSIEVYVQGMYNNQVMVITYSISIE